MARPASLGPHFASLLSAAFVTNIGDGIRLAALPLLAASLTDSPFLIGTVTAAQFLPWTTFAPFGGVIVDRSDRRRLILITQFWRALVMGALGIAVASDIVALWHVWLVAFVITVGEILVDPSVVATVPTLVDLDDLDRANGRISAVETVTNDFAGGPLGAFTFSVAPWLPFVIDGGTYLASILPFRKLPEDERRAASDQAPRTWAAVRAEMPAGLRWILSHAFLRPWTTAVAVSNVGRSAAFSLLVVLVLQTVEATAAVYGATLAAAALGATLGSSVAAGLVDRVSRRAVLTAAATLAGATSMLMAAAEVPWHLYAVWFVNGIGGGVLIAIARGFVQRYTPNDVLGRTAIASRSITRTAFVVGALLGGAVASTTGVRAAFVLAGGLELVGAAMMARALTIGEDANRL